MKHFFLTSARNAQGNREFLECEIVTATARRRSIKITEPGHPDFDKVLAVHPEGVAPGNLYPRVFASETKPTDTFEFMGRVLAKKVTGQDYIVPEDAVPNYLIPKLIPYSFQPITRNTADSILDGDKVLLTGEAGTGKTSLIEQIAARINQPVLRVNLNGESRMSDFIGRPQVVAGETGSVTKWTDGILPTAMKMGYWLILDEVDFAQPEILSLLHPVLEPNGKLVIKENAGEEVKPHPNFRLFGTANSIGSMQGRADSYTGTNNMNVAFMDRWHVITVPHLGEKDEIKVLREATPHLPPRMAKRIVQFANTLRKGADQTGINLSLSTRVCLAWAAKTALYSNAKKGAAAVFMEKVPASDKDVLLKQLDLHFGKNGKGSKARKLGGVAQVPTPDAPKRKRGRPKKVQP